MKEVKIQATINNISQGLQSSLSSLTHTLKTEISSSFIYAVSPTARIDLLSNGNFLITITDKNGTTSAEIPVINQENVENVINNYFQKNPLIQQYIQQHNESNTAHQDIRQLIINAISSIPTRISQLENDQNFIKNFKDLIVEYPSYYNFPNIPNEEEKNMIFLDKTTGDMYVFGLNNSLTYSSIGISSQDTIYGGDSIN